MAEQTQTMRFTDLVRGPFLSVRRVPLAGYRWVERITPWTDDAPAERPGPWLVEAPADGTGPWSRRRAPLYAADLHRRFARLATPRAYLGFADRYGLLGCEEQVLVGEPVPPLSGEGPTTWTHSGVSAEPLHAWERETRRMAVLLALWDLVDQREVGELGRYIRWHRSPLRVRMKYAYTLEGRARLLPMSDGTIHRMPRGWVDPAGRRVGLRTAWLAIAGTADGDELLALWRHGDALEPAREHVIREVNTRLRGHVSPTLLTIGGIYFQPDSLLAALYTLFAMEVSGQQDRPRLPCAHCGRYFTPSRKGQRHCQGTCRKLAWYHRKKRRPANEKAL